MKRSAMFLTALAIGGIAAVAAIKSTGSPDVQPQGPVKFSKTAPTPSIDATYERAGQTIAPYVVHLTATSLQIAWRTAGPTPGKARLLSGEQVQQDLNGPLGYQHTAHFQELLPDQSYRYQVDGFESQVVHTMRTVPGRKFAVVGHTHGTEHMDHYPDALLAASIRDFDPDYVVHAGDCVYYSTPQGWAEYYFRLFGETLSDTPFYIAPGNHDSGWPFLDGYDLRCFRELFPHNYPAAIKQGPEDAFYHVRQGSIDFYFLSYVADMAPSGRQHQWLMEQLQSSEAAFRVVVYGGMNNYFDPLAFRDSLPADKVDLIINGDGAIPKEFMDSSKAIPRIIMGTSAAHPHPWLAGTADEYSITLKALFADGKAGKTYWLHKRQVQEPSVVMNFWRDQEQSNKLITSFKPEKPVTSDQVKGVQIKLNNPNKVKALCFVSFQPTERLGKGEFGFRSQYVSIGPGDQLVTFAVPQSRPMGNGPYGIQRIQVVLIGSKAPPKMSLGEVYLFDE